MEYPKWVNEPGLCPEEATRRRITFILKRAALRVDPRGGITHLSEAAGLERSYLHRFMEHHRLSDRAARLLSNVMTQEEIEAVQREVALLHNPAGASDE